jgi:hypothetical protein
MAAPMVFYTVSMAGSGREDGICCNEMLRISDGNNFIYTGTIH